jgi:hypothetical protein
MKKLENGSSDIACKTLERAYNYAFNAANSRIKLEDKRCAEGNSSCSLCSKRIQVILQIQDSKTINTIKVSGNNCAEVKNLASN